MKKPARLSTSSLAFNHAMIYAADVSKSLAFYRDALGFRLIESWGDGYARLKSPGGTTSIALHALGEDKERINARLEGLRLYFEVKDVDAAVERLTRLGYSPTPAKDMPWGWRHSYVRDPDGHEISLYWAGAKRLRKTKR